MGDAARERSQAYDWGTAMERIVSYYDEVLNPEPAKGAMRSSQASVG